MTDPTWQTILVYVQIASMMKRAASVQPAAVLGHGRANERHCCSPNAFSFSASILSPRKNCFILLPAPLGSLIPGPARGSGRCPALVPGAFTWSTCSCLQGHSRLHGTSRATVALSGDVLWHLQTREHMLACKVRSSLSSSPGALDRRHGVEECLTWSR